jgi:uncharacterized protein YndB with AHSA1/START domain
MTTPESATRTVVVEREFPHPAEKLWRALTDSSVLAQWLLKNDFAPVAGHAFRFRRDPMPGWDGVIDCKVVAVDPYKMLSYTWVALGLESVVTFRLTATEAGTHLRVEQTGFRADQEAAFKGSYYGWRGYLGGLERVVAELK